MSSPFQRLIVSWKAIRQFGAGQTFLYAWYRLNLASGRYARQNLVEPGEFIFQPVLALPPKKRLLEILGTAGKERLLAQAEEILQGRWRRFGGEPVPLNWNFPGNLAHWSDYERGRAHYPQADGVAPEAKPDVKFLWEAGRFGWAFVLARAYTTSLDERYAQAFWELAENFWASNPPGYGPHWTSAQEVALRLIGMVFAGQVFSGSESTQPARLARLGREIAACARRIPATLVYARSQNNNHLLTEAAGLYTAALALPDHPEAARWRAIGWDRFHQGLASQIDADGAYIQQSANYHRLMLQISLWVAAIANWRGEIFPEESCNRLAKATQWLAQLTDSETGRAPNLGPNDGAYILLLDTCLFEDYRPVLQAASLAFLGKCLYSSGPWDEQAIWLGRDPQDGPPPSQPVSHPGRIQTEGPASPHILRCHSTGSWAYLRAARFRARPGHDDQLHLDIWWQGMNLALDAGTYLYSGLSPWENSLARAACHNTVTINGQDPMTRAGRFLWLDWAQAELISAEYDGSGQLCRLTARHDGYQRRWGVVHERSVACQEDGWLVEDRLLPADSRQTSLPVQARLHWLLPDFSWRIEPELLVRDIQIDLLASQTQVQLVVLAQAEEANPNVLRAGLIRAGVRVYGSGEADATLGWYSPTYGVKLPALSFYVDKAGSLPITFQSRWYLPVID